MDATPGAAPDRRADGADVGRAIQAAVPLLLVGSGVGAIAGAAISALGGPFAVVQCLALAGVLPAASQVAERVVAGHPPLRRRASHAGLAAHATASTGLFLVLVNTAYVTGASRGGPAAGLAALSFLTEGTLPLLLSALIFGVPFGAAARGRVGSGGVNEDGLAPAASASGPFGRDLAALDYLILASPIVGVSLALIGYLIGRLRGPDAIVAGFFGTVGILAAGALVTSLLFALDAAAARARRLVPHLRRAAADR